MKQIARFLFVVLLGVGVSPPSLTAQAVAAGDLVKASTPAVYYLAEDGNRYSFSSEPIFNSWFDDFSGVKEISDDALASYPLAGAITYRPGTRLLKLRTDPRVYTVEYGGILRWIENEALAKQLFGSAWAQKVDDLDVTFFSHYLVGDPIDEPRHPDGTVIAYTADGPRYVVWHDVQRKITGDAFSGNNFREADVNIISDPAVTYRDGEDLSSIEAPFTDPAEVDGLLRQTEPVTIRSAEFRTDGVLQDANDVPLLGFVVQTREAIEISKMQLEFEAHTSDDKDDDEGGLVNGQTRTANLQNIEVTFPDGSLAFGPVGLSTADGDDDDQTLAITDTLTLGPGLHTLFVEADINEDYPVDEQFSVELDTEFFEVDGENLGEGFPTVRTPTITVRSGALVVDLGDGALNEEILINQQDEFVAQAFELFASGNESFLVNELTVSGYIDEGEGDDDFVLGADEDNGSATTLADVITRVRLTDEQGTELGVISPLPGGGELLFASLNLDIDAGETKTLLLHVTPASDVPKELGADRIAFDIADAEEDIVLDDIDQEIEGNQPNNGSFPEVFYTFGDHGELSMTAKASSTGSVVYGEENISAMTLTFASSDVEAFTVEKLGFTMSNATATRSISSYILEYPDENGVTQQARLNQKSKDVWFENLAIYVPRDDDVDVRLRFDVEERGLGVTSGDEFSFVFQPGAPFRAVGVSSGEVFDDADEISTTLNTSNTFRVKRNRPVFETSDIEAPAGVDRRFEEIMPFRVDVMGDGNTEIHKLTFKIVPNDVGFDEGGDSDNDLLEYLADLDGDAQDDDSVADLVRDDPGDVVGEGSSAALDFSIFDDSIKTLDTTPQGLDTEKDDYGVLVYEFRQPIRISEPTDFILSLDLRGFSIDGGSIDITILDGDDFAWNDGEGFIQENGDNVPGLSFSLPAVGVSGL